MDSETLVLNGHGVAKFLLSRAVRNAGIEVVLTGEGAVLLVVSTCVLQDRFRMSVQGVP